MNLPKMVKDRRGVRYGRLVVLGFFGSPPPKYNAKWKCLCDCGNESIVTGHKLGKETMSCGCLKREIIGEISRTHGQSHGINRTYLYVAWCNAKSRCKPGWIEPWNYFDRGITVCDEWVNDFPAFRDWIIQNIGDKPGSHYSIDRIDNNKGYQPGNIRWATPSRQTRNTRLNIRVIFNGKEGVLRDVCEENGLDFKLILGRLHNGWTFEEAVKHPKAKGILVHQNPPPPQP
jgi:hypothetical protein